MMFDVIKLILFMVDALLCASWRRWGVRMMRWSHGRMALQRHKRWACRNSGKDKGLAMHEELAVTISRSCSTSFKSFSIHVLCIVFRIAKVIWYV